MSAQQYLIRLEGTQADASHCCVYCQVVGFPTVWLLNPLVTNGLSHPYRLDESISVFWGIGSNFSFLAHLSQRLIGELIGYSWSGVRPSASVRRPSSVVNNFKRLLLRNRWADQSQILCGASLGRGNDILFAASGSHDQDGRHAHIW